MLNHRNGHALKTPFGRLRGLRMPFGVEPAPKLFAVKMHNALRGLNGVACLTDDILTYGCGDRTSTKR